MKRNKRTSLGNLDVKSKGKAKPIPRRSRIYLDVPYNKETKAFLLGAEYDTDIK